MKKLFTAGLGVLAVAAAAGIAPVGGASPSAPAAGPPDRTVVFVRSQQLYYDSIVLGELPPFGPFQVLEDIGGRLETDYGPGDKGYVGGRWELDMGGGNVLYFLCPLLPPGRPEP